MCIDDDADMPYIMHLPGSEFRLKFPHLPDCQNATRSMTSLIDFDAVEKANKESKKGK